MRHNITKLSAAVLVVSAISGVAHAGGFSRGTADTDVLYEDDQFVMRGGALFVNPQQSYDTVGGVAVGDSAYSDSYVVPSVALKARLFDRFACAFTYTQPFGADSTYGSDTIARNKLTTPGGETTGTGTHFSTNEFGGTCGVNMDAGPGRAWLIGGIFNQSFDYTENILLRTDATTFLPGSLTLKDTGAFGYRIGAAYEIPEYKLRGELMYRSAVDHSGGGLFTVPAAGVSRVTAGTGTMPQSLSLKVQSGIAPGWLAFGAVTWTDWSVLPALNYTVAGVAKRKNFNFQDGWTVTAGVGHAFNDDVSGSLSLTWDRGVGTGTFIMTDTWTLATGVQAKAGPGTLRLGGALSYLSSGEQFKANGGSFDATVGNDWSYAVGASYLVKF